MKQVFISYSHDSDEHREKVLLFSNLLIDWGGINSHIDQYHEYENLNWVTWMYQKIEQAEFILIVCTEKYYQKTVDGIRSNGKGVKSEIESILTLIYDNVDKKIFPVIFNREDVAFIPTPIRGKTHFLLSEEKEIEKLYKIITNQVDKIKPDLKEDIKKIPDGKKKQ